MYLAMPLVAHRHGVVAGARYAREPVPAGALALLHEAERDAATTAGSAVATAFVAGRLALRAALEVLTGLPQTGEALLSTPRGAPVPPIGFVASVTHKDGIALALAAADGGQHVGIDLEALTPRGGQFARRILGEEELREFDAAAPKCRWSQVIVRFSVKEAVFKAVDASVNEQLEFKEISVGLQSARGADGFQIASVVIHGGGAAALLAIEATYRMGGAHVITTAETSGKAPGMIVRSRLS